MRRTKHLAGTSRQNTFIETLIGVLLLVIPLLIRNLASSTKFERNSLLLSGFSNP